MVVGNRLDLLANSWSTAAIGYDQVFVPRFAPWTNTVLESLQELPLPPRRERQQQPLVTNDIDVNVDIDGENDDVSTRVYHCCVPCCGPGQELFPILTILGDQWIVTGIDLAPGMIQVANERIVATSQLVEGLPVDDDDTNQHYHHQQQSVRAIVGDCSKRLPSTTTTATTTISSCTEYDLIVSIFGFQQMSEPETVLELWLDSLCIGGYLVLCFWPTAIEDFVDDDDDDNGDKEFAKKGNTFIHSNNSNDTKDDTTTSKTTQGIVTVSKPFSKFAQVVKRHLATLESLPDATTDTPDPSKQPTATKKTATSTETLQQSGGEKPAASNDDTTNKRSTSSWDDNVVKKARCLGARITRDDYVTHSICWDDFNHFWNSMTHSGPWHAMRLKRGNDFVDGLKDEYQSHFPRGGQPFSHRARARLLILQKEKTSRANL